MNERLDLVRTEVRRLLDQSEAFARLEPEQKRQLSSSLVKVSEFLADPAWLGQQADPRLGRDAVETIDRLREKVGPKGEGGRLAVAQDAAEDVGSRLAEKPGQVGTDFKAGGVREGVDAFKNMVKTVDFPEFVSGLVQGVFEAVVKASIEQMHAYGEMMAAVAKSVDQFANENFTEGQARDAIANRYPQAVEVVAEEGGARLRWREGLSEPPPIGADYGLPADLDLNDEEAERQIMVAARLEMARSRQQLLATMVLLGINRIIVTNGKINAKVVFDMKANDQAGRQARASMIDEKASASSASASAFGFSPWGGGGASASTSKSHKTTVQSSVEDQSESKAEVKAQLTGEVSLNFKSETFPLEKLATPEGMSLLQNRAQPVNPPGMPTAAPPSPRPTPTAPAPPGAAPART